MPYTKAYAGGWQNGSAGTTPIDAASLNTMETGIQTAFNNYQIAASAPSSPLVGHLWYDTTNAVLKFWNGSFWLSALTVAVTYAQAGAYTLAISDQRNIVEMSGGGTLTIPLNATVAFPILNQITVIQTGASQVTIAGAGGVTVNATPGLKLRTQWSSATLIKRATNTWVAIGDLTV